MMVTSRIRARYFWAMTHYLKPNHLPAYSDGSLAEISHSRVQNRPRKSYSRNPNGDWSASLVCRRCQTSDTQMTFNGLSPPRAAVVSFCQKIGRHEVVLTDYNSDARLSAAGA